MRLVSTDRLIFFSIPAYIVLFLCMLMILTYTKYQTSLVAQMVKNLPTIQETQVLSLDQEDALEKGMAVHSNILA